MAEFRFTGAYETYYPEIVDPVKGVLVGRPGEVYELDEAPKDGRWVKAGAVKTAKAAKE